MPESITIARPYAKAAFEFALEHQSIDLWQEMLLFAATVTRNEKMFELLSGVLAPKTLSNIFIDICSDRLDKYGQNFIHIMAENKRLLLLPIVLDQFMMIRNELDSIVEVDALSANRLSATQKAKIVSAIEKRLSMKVKLNCKIDKSVIAGIIIRIGDMVIDSSLRGRLERLTDILQS